MRRVLAIAVLAGLASAALAEPAPPVAADSVARIEVGLFCALQATGQAPAPGTLSGSIHLIDTDVAFHWPDRQVIPAAIGLAFGVRAQLVQGADAPFAEMRVYRPGLATPEVWGSAFSDAAPSLAFFRFDTPAELVPGIWLFEAWDGDIRLYSVEFEVVPEADLPGVATACGAIS